MLMRPWGRLGLRRGCPPVAPSDAGLASGVAGRTTRGRASDQHSQSAGALANGSPMRQLKGLDNFGGKGFGIDGRVVG